MFGTQNFSLFVVSCILLNITPGQDTLFIVGRTLARGRKAGIVSTMGIMSGVLVHTLLAALGLSVILATSAVAFSVVKFAGAGYLIWLGVGMLRRGGHREDDAAVDMPRASVWKLYRQGVVTNVLNPKVSIFFLSFLPQFVDVQAGMVVLPFLFLGMTFFTTGSIWCLFLVFAAAWLTGSFRRHTTAGGALKKLTGTLFIGLGIRLALTHR
jgi:threonine/homoserine/homoserine lactone efflux protein